MKENRKKLGILGGMGSQASTWLLNRIVALCKAQTDQDYPEIVLHNNSSIPDRTQAILYGGDSPVPEMKRSLSVFDQSNMDLVVMACMTAHHFYDEIKASFSGTILHPIDFVVEELSERLVCTGKTKIGLIGSTGMINSGVFHKKLIPLGYEMVVLDPDDQQKYFMDPIYNPGGFKSGEFSDENVQLFLYQIDLLKSKGAEIIVGACSEIPLVINQYNVDIPFIDSFELLAQRVVDHCYNNQQENVL